ncbi:BfmA/BtgA family mobilization protein [Hymenobacter glacieicola]|uniref:Uncharacterized protein n=1 Tax=Hymenobacter glacieicola TaxID=1562124 RepID=A0ABQ1X6J0_9BACT|nr:BfmA/BtgA family mobilization protein [Hymenobacter glacieicola]GGG60380.1 hypothetical protein GCM10011378_40440 [Hymenobacter glacieicola]
MPTKEGIVNVSIRTATHHLVAKERKRLKATQTDYIDAAVRYFAERGLDPIETQAREGQLIMNGIGRLQGDFKKLGDRVFSYIVEQENTIHLPMLEELVRARVTQEKTLQILQVIDANMRKQSGETLAKVRAEDQQEIDSIVQKVLSELRKPGE